VGLQGSDGCLGNDPLQKPGVGRYAYPSPFHLSRSDRRGKAEAGVLWVVMEGYPYLSRRAMMIGAGCRVGEAETAHPKAEPAGCRAQVESGARQACSRPFRWRRVRARGGRGRRACRSCGRSSVWPRPCGAARASLGRGARRADRSSRFGAGRVDRAPAPARPAAPRSRARPARATQRQPVVASTATASTRPRHCSAHLVRLSRSAEMRSSTTSPLSGSKHRRLERTLMDVDRRVQHHEPPLVDRGAIVPSGQDRALMTSERRRELGDATA